MVVSIMAERSDSLRIVTWNVNSIRLRLVALARIVDMLEPDIICLQETKVEDSQFPHEDFEKLGFSHRAVRGEKSYNGVAILSREPIVEVSHINFCGKGDCRHISARIRLEGKNSKNNGKNNGKNKVGASSKIISIDNLYVPAGGYVADVEVNEKFQHKLDFVEEMATIFSHRTFSHRTFSHSKSSEDSSSDGRNGADCASILLGDLNIAPLANDVWAHERMLRERVVSHTEEEIALFERARTSGGWCDVMREVYPPTERLYSWWSYRQPQWREKDYGRRLDHIWANEIIAKHLSGVRVLKEARGWERPSDHAPVLAEFDIDFC